MKYIDYLKAAKEINNNEKVNKEVLLYLINKDSTFLYANLNSFVDKNFFQEYLTLIKKYAQGCPLAYILGYSFFYGNKILVNENVLIPRFETEQIIDLIIEYSKDNFKNQNLKVLDLCTGSGAIALSLGLKKPNWEIIASDISVQALAITKKNVDYHQLNNIKIMQSDLFNNLDNQKFDIIVCNPPYIDKQGLDYDKEKLSYEPAIALFAKEKGFYFYQEIFKQVSKYVNDNFILFFEIGFDQRKSLEKMAINYFGKESKIVCCQDYSGHDRFLIISSTL